jgi:hypothetical protein
MCCLSEAEGSRSQHDEELKPTNQTKENEKNRSCFFSDVELMHWS